METNFLIFVIEKLYVVSRFIRSFNHLVLIPNS